MPRASQETAYFTTAGLKYTGSGVLTGINLTESSGSATAKIKVRDGAIGGQVLDERTFNASESIDESVEERVFAAGLYIEFVSGTVEGVLLFRDS